MPDNVALIFMAALPVRDCRSGPGIRTAAPEIAASFQSGANRSLFTIISEKLSLAAISIVSFSKFFTTQSTHTIDAFSISGKNSVMLLERLL